MYKKYNIFQIIGLIEEIKSQDYWGFQDEYVPMTVLDYLCRTNKNIAEVSYCDILQHFRNHIYPTYINPEAYGGGV